MEIPAWEAPASEPAPAAPVEPSAAPGAPAEPAVPAWEAPAEPAPAAEAPPPAAEPAAPAPSADANTNVASGGETMAMPAWTPPAATPPPPAEAAPPAEAPAASEAPPAAEAASPIEAAPTAPNVERTIFVDSTAVPPAAGDAVPALPEGELVIASGPDSGHTFRVSGPAIRIGRAPDNDMVLRDPATSGHHARVERRGNEFYVVDLGSTNGTLVNGEVVMEHLLKDGDSITIGQNAVTFAIR